MFLLLTVYSCISGDEQPLLPSVSGKVGEITIVINKAEWDTKIGEEFRRIFETPYDLLPQYEPIYDIIQVPYDGFGNIMKAQRNIIVVEIAAKYKKDKVLIQKDVWAKPQLVFSMYAKDDNAFISLLKENEKKIVNLLENMERNSSVYFVIKNLT